MQLVPAPVYKLICSSIAVSSSKSIETTTKRNLKEVTNLKERKRMLKLAILAVCLVVLGHQASAYIISSANGQCDCELETDYLGNDLTQFAYSPVTLEECCSYCQLTSNCLSFTQIPQFSQCWPKFTSEGRLRVLNSPGRISCKKLAKVVTPVPTTTTTTTPTTTTTTTTTTTKSPTCL